MRTLNVTLMAGAAMAMAAVSFVPAAHAQNSNYDGYCYAKRESNKTTGTVVGAIAGGLLGSQISKNERGLGTVGGAVIGGAVGRSIGASTTKCLNGEYYSYQSGYYNPAPAPDGYDVVYYNQRPSSNAYNVVYYDPYRRSTQPGYASNDSYNNGYSNNGAYNNGNYNNGNAYVSPSTAPSGWRDSYGTWHSGQPTLGWRDSRGRWHKGQVTYGYQDSNGNWREMTTYNGNAYYNPAY